jgi:aminopeptidase YwaD
VRGVLALLIAAPALAAEPPLLPPGVGAALAQEISGESAKRNLEALARHHRMRGSREFRAAAEHVASQLRAHGLSEVGIESFPADGTAFYGTQRSRPAWDAEFAELWEMRREGGAWLPARRLASFEAMPVSLAQDSESAEVTADLVDVGDGTREEDYAARDVRGRLVLAAAQPGPVARLAVERHGAAGIVSYAQNQRTAWWGDDDNLVRWGHLDSFSLHRTFAFMVSLRQARELQQRLRDGQTVRLKASVKAARHAGTYDVVTATLPGADPALRAEEIVFSCHLDHQRPGANDNASGCVTILEAARALSKLVREGRIAPPARTLRFVWPPEIEGTLTYLSARPEVAARARAAIHLDMVGGGPVTKAIFHVTRGPASLPSFIYDVAAAVGEFVNAETAAFASGRPSDYPLHAPEGGKEALQAEMAEFSLGSDHQVYTDSSFAVPAIYLNDWPDRYIHTNFDSPANIDPTKLKRAAFIAAACGYLLADLGDDDAAAVWSVVRRAGLQRAAGTLQRAEEAGPGEAQNVLRFQLEYERAVGRSLERFLRVAPGLRTAIDRHLTTLAAVLEVPERAPREAGSGAGADVYRRRAEVKGPVAVFGYDYLEDKYGHEQTAALRLLRFQGRRGGGDEYAYEALNLLDGRRRVRDVRDALSAVYGPVPLDVVEEYVGALAAAGLAVRVSAAPAH